jgi:Flp pilus assembly protein TadG
MFRARVPSLDNCGTVVVEFALIGPCICLLMLGALEVGRYQITMHSLRLIAATASRIVSIAAAADTANTCAAVPSNTALQWSAVATNPAPLISGGSLSISSTCASVDANGVTKVVVTASYPFTVVVPVLGSGTMTLTAIAALTF